MVVVVELLLLLRFGPRRPPNLRDKVVELLLLLSDGDGDNDDAVDAAMFEVAVAVIVAFDVV